MTVQDMKALGLSMKDRHDLVKVATAMVRKERLSQIAKMPLNVEEVSPRDVISAIDTLNKMDGMYSSNPAVNYSEIKIVVVEKGALPVIKPVDVVCEVKNEEITAVQE